MTEFKKRFLLLTMDKQVLGVILMEWLQEVSKKYNLQVKNIQCDKKQDHSEL